MQLVTAAQMQAMDRAAIADFGLPGRVLMENAGRGVVQALLQTWGEPAATPIGIAAGRGNNGGDGFVVARYLAQRGHAVVVFLLSVRDRVGGDAAANLALLDPLGVPVRQVPDAAAFARHEAEMRHCRFWVDAIFGTGLNAEVGGVQAAMIDLINAAGRPVLAVDIASGLEADTGRVLGRAVRADLTVTFARAKIGHWMHPGAALTGRLFVADIGIPGPVAGAVHAPQHLIDADLARRDLPVRPADAHKGTTGHLLVAAGSTGKIGAAVMTAAAAMRSGAGLVTLAVPAASLPVAAGLVREVMTAPLADTPAGALDLAALPALERLYDAKGCLALGPGLGTAEETARLVQAVVRQCPLPMVLDADALNILARSPRLLSQARGPLILTPHPGEMARLTGAATAAIQADRVGAARALAQSHGVWVVLKGAGTVVAAPDGRIWINASGNAGMAGGGMGDVLTGLIAGFVTQQLSPGAAARLAVFAHGAAADRLAVRLGPQGYLATEVMGTVPEILRDLAAGGGFTPPATQVPF
jgi:NAD(P)H-hydrate epimerase